VPRVSLPFSKCSSWTVLFRRPDKLQSLPVGMPRQPKPRVIDTMRCTTVPRSRSKTATLGFAYRCSRRSRSGHQVLHHREREIADLDVPAGGAIFHRSAAA